MSILRLPEHLFSDDGSLNDLLLYQDAARDSQACGGAGEIQARGQLQVPAPSSASTVAPLTAASTSSAPTHVSEAPAPPTSVASLPGTDGQTSASINEPSGEGSTAQLGGEAGNSKG
jgi:hypothetical protein